MMSRSLRSWPILTRLLYRIRTSVAGHSGPIRRIPPEWAGVKRETQTESFRQMAEEFRRGMANALGVHPEAFREDVVQSWILNWTLALAKPEYWVEVAPTTDEMRELGRELREIAKSALFKL